MKTWLLRNKISIVVLLLVPIASIWAINRFHRPGQLDVIAAQAMDMSQMQAPTGAAPVELTAARLGSLSNTVTYTGAVQAYNQQAISPRITGAIISLPVYPGDTVRAGELVAQLDTSQVGPQAAQAQAQALQAQEAENVARLTHHLHHYAELSQAQAQEQAAVQSVQDARAEEQAQQDEIADAEGGVQSAQANADYWKTEIAREKQLADAGAVSQQEYQNELAQAQAAAAALGQAKAKLRSAMAMARADQAKVAVAQKQVAAAQASTRMAQADLTIAAGQITQEQANAQAAQAAAQAAYAQEGYAQIHSPANGVVIDRPVAPGTLVQPGTTILTIAEIDRVRIQANVAVTDMAGIHPGSPVEITLPSESSAKPIMARVTSVFPAANDQSRTAVVEAVIPNPSHRLLPGAFVTMQITTGRVSDRLLVPASAVQYDNGQAYVWTAQGGATTAGPTRYRCVKCGIIYSADQARKYHYIDPMDGGKLVPADKGPSTGSTAPPTAHRVDVSAGASDGVSTEISSGDIQAGDQVVSHGAAGLVEGAKLDAVSWGSQGPQALPTVAQADKGATFYKCVKCGIVYSAEQAKKYHYIDPMDGGNLVPVTPSAGKGK